MKTRLLSARPGRVAFTLIELLIVIAIIGVLAALILPVGGAIKDSAKKKRTQTELSQLETAIERYKARHGSNPPDNRPTDTLYSANQRYFVTNQLYFELIGTQLENNTYKTLDASAQIQVPAIPSAFGSKVTGFVNATRVGSGDDVQKAENFLPGLNPGQIYELSPGVKILVGSVDWRDDDSQSLGPGNKGKNPWRYNSSNPTNNTSSYDLWIDILIRGKTNRISNWSKQPQIVYSP